MTKKGENFKLQLIIVRICGQNVCWTKNNRVTKTQLTIGRRRGGEREEKVENNKELSYNLTKVMAKHHHYYYFHCFFRRKIRFTFSTVVSVLGRKSNRLAFSDLKGRLRHICESLVPMLRLQRRLRFDPT